MTQEYMQSEEFVALLNGNVTEYNAASPTVAALEWQAVSGGYPTFVE